MTVRILIVDDEKDMLNVLKRIISEKRNYSVTIEPDPIIALELFMKEPFDLVITDLKMPGMDGIKLLEEVKKISPGTSVFVMTAYGTIETAVDAIKKGAYDYITKPFLSEHVLLTIDKAVKWRQMVKENLALRQALEEKEDYPPIIGASPAIREVFENISQVAPSMATVLITGPSGTGKELVAGAIHRNSRRSSKAMVTINCTALPEQIMESELFGHVKGAFTGAWRDKKGLIDEAHEGTLFLDEIADLSPFMQTKLLRLLQDGEYKPVGGVFTKKADIRVIAATNHDITRDVKEKRFREDLYYRLNVVHIELPPLSERKEDIPLLAYHFMEKYARINQKDIREISTPAMQALLLNEMPGNIRELENIIERGIIFCQSNVMEMKDLFPKIELKPPCLKSDQDMYMCCIHLKDAKGSGIKDFKKAKEEMIRLFHSWYVKQVFLESRGNITRAADMAGIQRPYLYRLMKEAGINRKQFKPDPDLTQTHPTHKL